MPETSHRQSRENSALKVGLLTCELNHTHGWAHYSLSLIQALRRAGLEMTVVVAQSSPPVEGLTVYRLLPDTNPRADFLLAKMVLKFQTISDLLRDCDIIHATIEPYAPVAAWIAGKRSLVITGHGSYMRLSQERRWPVNALYRRAFEQGHIVCVSHYTESVVRSVLPAVRTTVINNGVDVERFQTSATSRQPSEIPTILSVGAVKPRKGTLELVRALAEVRRQIPAVQCIIIGSLTQEPAYAERVREALHDLQLEGCVQLLGHVPDEILLDWYERAHIFVLPSINDGWKFEGYGIVYLEASATGLPVIGTTDNGAEDAVDDGATGLLIPQSQVKEKLPHAILRLLADPQLAAQMGAAGRAKALRQTWDTVATQMVALYNAEKGYR
jgi:glycosyltransferase involved in cell wall biosynthesis